MNLQEIRNEIDSIDDQIIDLFLRRMECSRKVARYKIENGIPVFNAEREKKILDSIGEKAGIYVLFRGFVSRGSFRVQADRSLRRLHDQ